jgi:hypothetical protein
MAITIIMIVVTTLLLWLALGGIVAALVGPLLKEKDSTPPSRDDHRARSEPPARSASKA